jgi:hypothetical protein
MPLQYATKFQCPNVLVCDTLTDLRAVGDTAYGNPQENWVAITCGYSVKFDGTYRISVFDASATDSDDDDLVIKPDNIAAEDPGRWISVGCECKERGQE